MCTCIDSDSRSPPQCPSVLCVIVNLSPLFIHPLSFSASRANTVAEEETEMDSASLPSQLKNIKGARALATDITERGARLFDLLGKEVDVRVERSKVRGLLFIYF
jgi:clusterin-associated protein 1